MISSSYRILMFSMSSYEEWKQGTRNRNYYILHELLKRPEIKKVIMVEYLPIQWRKKLRALWFVLLGIYKSNYQVIAKDYGGILYSVDGKLKVYTSYRMGGLLSRLRRFTDTPLETGEKQIIWSYFPLYTGYLYNLRKNMFVFDAVDDWRAHPAYHKYIKLLAKNYDDIAKKADYIFTVSQHLKQHLFSDNKNARWIPNGVDVENFAEAPSQTKKTGKKIIVGYVGTIQSRVDFELVCFLAERHPDKQFVFVGPVWKDAEAHRISNCGNVILTGPVPHDELKHYLTTFDAAIIPHKVNPLTISMNPMKFYEYLAFGLPVVSTQKIVDDERLLYHAKNREEFSEHISRAIAENTPEFEDYRMAYASNNSWKNKVDEMMRVIKEMKIAK
ncbi:MAG: glycosyltransferase [Candidatus Jacksonbacteria bacterium]|nr:glycosyltransferase [Candidatus Jacksonbacteria bacterium]